MSANMYTRLKNGRFRYIYAVLVLVLLLVSSSHLLAQDACLRVFVASEDQSLAIIIAGKISTFE